MLAERKPAWLRVRPPAGENYVHLKTLFRSLDLRERGFAVEAEIMARLLGRGVRIYEVPVEYRARSREEGKKLTALDGLRVLSPRRRSGQRSRD